jgi:hypothetical protein
MQCVLTPLHFTSEKSTFVNHYFHSLFPCTGQKWKCDNQMTTSCQTSQILFQLALHSTAHKLISVLKIVEFRVIT